MATKQEQLPKLFTMYSSFIQQHLNQRKRQFSASLEKEGSLKI